MNIPRTYGEVAWQSLFPEEVLVEARDTQALFEKRHTALDWRLAHLFSTRRPYSGKGCNLFGPLILSVEDIPARGYDQSTGEAVVQRDEQVIGLHFAPFKSRSGLQELKEGLHQAAEFTRDLPDAPEKIASLTHLEFSRLATRLGFQALRATDVDPKEEFSLQIAHDIFNLYNKRNNPLVPTVVMMPTDEFVAKYAPAS